MRSVLLAVSALVYLASTVVVSGALFGIGAQGCDEGCNEPLGRPRWWNNGGSWQWDAMGWLGLAAGVAGIVYFVLALVAPGRPIIPSGALAVFAAILLAALAFYWPTQSGAPSDARVAFLVTVGSGAAFVYLNASRHRAGTRRE